MQTLLNWLLARPTTLSKNRRNLLRDRASRRLLLESLEGRVVFNATFDSAVSVGSTGADAAFDVATDTAGNKYMPGYFHGTVDFDPAAVHVGDTDIRSTAGDESDIYLTKYAPDGSFLWVRQMVGDAGPSTNNSVARSVATDASGNAYVAGDFMGTVTFGTFPLTSANGTKDGFVAKVDPDGNVLWANRIGGADKEYIEAIAVDGAGNVVTADYTITAGTMEVDKFGPTGTPLWQKQIGNATTGRASAYGVGTDAAGNVFVAGGFTSTVDFDPGPAVSNVKGGANGNGFVLKLTAAGNFGWVSPFISQDSVATSNCEDLAVDGSGNIVVGGSYRGPVDFKPGSGTLMLPYTSDTTGGGFVEKLNSSGSLLWAQPVGAVGATAVKGLTLDSTGNVYLVGTFQGTADFDPGAGQTILTSNGSTDVFVAKFTAAGSYQWAISFGGTGLDSAEGIAVDGSGNVYVAGWYNGSVDFDPDPINTYLLTSAGGSDGFLLKLKQV